MLLFNCCLVFSRFIICCVLPAYIIICGYLWFELHYIVRSRLWYNSIILKNADVTVGDTPPIEEGYLLIPRLPKMDNETLLVYVMSRPSNYDRRQLIRDTWGNNSLFYKEGVKQFTMFFVVGTNQTYINQTSREVISNSGFVQEAIRDESSLSRDILMLDMYDSYDNLTLKGLMTMTWFMKHTTVNYLLKVDEDVMINPFAWIHLTKAYIANKLRCSVVGQSLLGVSTLREGKYGITRESYPFDKYPNFIWGPAYFLSRDAMAAILEISDHIRERFKLEDVYFHGILGNQAGVRILGMPRLCFHPDLNITRWVDNPVPILWVHGTSPSYAHYAWKVFQEQSRYGINYTLLVAEDYSSHKNIRKLLPERWTLPTNIILKNKCRPQQRVKVDMMI